MFVGPLRGPVGFDGWVNPASGSPLRGELHAVKHVRPSARVFLYPMGIHVSILAAGSAGCCEATFSLAEGDAARHVSTIFMLMTGDGTWCLEQYYCFWFSVLLLSEFSTTDIEKQ